MIIIYRSKSYIVVQTFVFTDILGENVRQRGMQVKEINEKGGSIAAVVESGRVKHLLVNNQYSLGSNRSIQNKRNQALLPMLLHQFPKICFIGMGTGITAGAAIKDPRVDSLVVCEILPGVVDLAKKYFAPYT